MSQCSKVNIIKNMGFRSNSKCHISNVIKIRSLFSWTITDYGFVINCFIFNLLNQIDVINDYYMSLYR